MRNEIIIENVDVKLLDKQREHLQVVIEHLDPGSNLHDSMLGIQNLLDNMSDQAHDKIVTTLDEIIQ
jgi:hypothetical protein